MEKYIIAPPAGSQTNALGAKDRPWEEVHAKHYPGINEYLAESTGYGIVSGCEPTINNLTVTVGVGIVHLVDGTRKEISATNITLDSADSTNPRIDLVYITSAGEVAKVTGTASASPSVSTLPTGGINVAQVSVAAGATTGTITDKRGMLARFYNMGIVNVKDFGAVGDGVHDDTAAIQRAIDSHHEATVYFPNGQYLISRTIYCYDKGKYSINFRLDHNARIFTDTSMDVMVEIGRYSGSDREYVSRGYLDKPSFVGGCIDGNKKALIGIKFLTFTGYTFENTTVVNCIDSHVQIGDQSSVTSSEFYARNLNIAQYGDNDSIGVKILAHDVQISNARIFGTKIGVWDTTGSLRADNVHACATAEAYENSVAFRGTGDGNIGSFSGCYVDGYETGFQLGGSYSLINCLGYWWENFGDYSKYKQPTYIDLSTYKAYGLNIKGVSFKSANNSKVIVLDKLPSSYSKQKYNCSDLLYKNIQIDDTDSIWGLVNETDAKPFTDLSKVKADKYYKIATCVGFNTYKVFMLNFSLYDSDSGEFDDINAVCSTLENIKSTISRNKIYTYGLQTKYTMTKRVVDVLGKSRIIYELYVQYNKDTYVVSTIVNNRPWHDFTYFVSLPTEVSSDGITSLSGDVIATTDYL